VGILVLVVKSGSFRTAMLTSRSRHHGEYSQSCLELSPYNQLHLTHNQICSAFGTNIFVLQKCLTSRQSHGFHVISICSTFYSNITLRRISVHTGPHVKHTLCMSSPALTHHLPRLHRQTPHRLPIGRPQLRAYDTFLDASD
jgi:hypothetical protein